MGLNYGLFAGRATNLVPGTRRELKHAVRVILSREKFNRDKVAVVVYY